MMRGASLSMRGGAIGSDVASGRRRQTGPCPCELYTDSGKYRQPDAKAGSVVWSGRL